MIYQFQPILKGTPWGGFRIRRMKGLTPSDEPVGESWELSAVDGCNSVVEGGPEAGLTLGDLVARHGAHLLGHRSVERYGLTFPLTVKFIDACKWLSLQVHPDGELARDIEGAGSPGKSEMWHIIDAAPGAELIVGFRPGVGAADYMAVEGSENVLELTERHLAKAGDDFFIEAGTIHALGAGCFVAEVSQNCDLTYRLYDYGRMRPLHFDKGRRALKFGKKATDTTCGDCFKMAHRVVEPVDEIVIEPVDGSFQAVMVLKGRCVIDGAEAPAGRTLLISADHGPATLCAEEPTEFLLISV